MAGAFFGAFFIEDEDSAMERRRAHYIVPCNTLIGGCNGADQRAFTHIRQLYGLVQVFIGQNGAHRAESLDVVGILFVKGVVIEEKNR